MWFYFRIKKESKLSNNRVCSFVRKGLFYPWKYSSKPIIAVITRVGQARIAGWLASSSVFTSKAMAPQKPYGWSKRMALLDVRWPLSGRVSTGIVTGYHL